jgi:hypothetical protein
LNANNTADGLSILDICPFTYQVIMCGDYGQPQNQFYIDVGNRTTHIDRKYGQIFSPRQQLMRYQGLVSDKPLRP